jgi:hypothetical protein
MFRYKVDTKKGEQAMKLQTSKIAALVISLIASIPSLGRSDVTINYWLQDFTIGASTNKITNGSLLFISHGTNNVFNSGSGWSSGTSSFILGDDSFLALVPIVNGKADGALANLAAPAGTSYGTTQFSILFINDISLQSNGSLLAGFTFGSGAGSTSYDYGTFRSSTIDRWGGEGDGYIAYQMPADGALVSFYSVSADQGGDIPAALNTTSAFSIVPEPTSASLLMIGAAGLIALRRLRKA